MKKWAGILFVLVVVFAAGMLANHYLNPRGSVEAGSSGGNESEIIYWVAPMDPTYRRDKPGKSPMGMDLVPVYEKNKNSNKNIVHISPEVQNNLGVKTALVQSINLSRIIDTVGYVTVDENNIEHIHTYAEGWVKILKVKTTGEPVVKGQLLMELYSPVLNNAQQELVLALKNNNQALIGAGEKKLLTLGMSQSQINRLKKTRLVAARVKIFATRGGIISALNVREGKFVEPATDLMTIQDLSHIWIIAEVFERQASWVETGQQAIATLSYVPGKIWQGVVDYVYPSLDQQTHTLRVRLTFPNPDLTIKPKMYANVKIYSNPFNNTLAIPREALIRTGSGDRVIIALGNGQFVARAVKVGIESGNYYQIISGLKKGDRVVTSAQFLIDSESNLKAGMNRMQGSTEASDANNDVPNSGGAPQEFVGMGTVSKVDVTNRTLTLEHQPIPSLNMPSMTMKLAVDDKVDLTGLNTGDSVHFVLIKQPGDRYLVIKIQRIEIDSVQQP